MADWQKTLSFLGFSAMTSSLKLIDTFNLPVISTARPFRFYREVFFEGRGEQDVLQSLRGNTVVDVGCGLTPYTEDSLFQTCRRAGIDCWGVDPKLQQGFRFGTWDALKARATGARSLPRADMPGQEKAVGAYANDMPFEDGSVDLILSSWLLFAWIRDEDILLAIFREFDRVLRAGGDVRFFPSMHYGDLARHYPRLAERLSRYRVEQTFQWWVGHGNLPATWTTRLIKPA